MAKEQITIPSTVDINTSANTVKIDSANNTVKIQSNSGSATIPVSGSVNVSNLPAVSFGGTPQPVNINSGSVYVSNPQFQIIDGATGLPATVVSGKLSVDIAGQSVSVSGNVGANIANTYVNPYFTAITNGTYNLNIASDGSITSTVKTRDIKSMQTVIVQPASGAVSNLISSVSGKAFRVYSVTLSWTSAPSANANVFIYSGSTSTRPLLATRIASTTTTSERSVTISEGILCPVSTAISFTIDSGWSSQVVFHIVYSEE